MFPFPDSRLDFSLDFELRRSDPPKKSF